MQVNKILQVDTFNYNLGEETFSREKGDEKVISIPKIKINKRRFPTFSFKKGKIIKYFLLVFLLILVLYTFFTYRFYMKVANFRENLESIKSAFQAQDFREVRKSIERTQESLIKLKSAYKPFFLFKLIPFLGGYIADGQHVIGATENGLQAALLLVDTIEPYADIVGFRTDSKEVKESNTAQERLDFVIKTIPSLILRADELEEKVKLIRKDVDKINPDRYPETILGWSVREKVKEGKELIEMAASLVENGKPLLESAPYLLGVEGKRRYLIIFQNDKELRPTGGFITAYSIAEVEKGRFEPGPSDDIYNLDGRYTPKIPAPKPIVKYLKGPYALSKNYRLRDMNWSPDFSKSMELFSRELKSAGVSGIDGIIALDTQVLVNILNALGPVQVPGFGEFSTKIVPECNCPQVIYELESFADVEGPVVWSENEPGKIVYAPPNYENRKKIIGPLMNSILSSILGASSDKFSMISEAVLKSLFEKHVLFYLFE